MDENKMQPGCEYTETEQQSLYLFDKAKERLRKNEDSRETLEDAIGFLSEAVKKMTQVYGETALKAAPIYLEYGKALYKQAMLLGEDLFFVLHGDTEAGGAERKADAVNEVESSLELAWEVLELARTVLSQQADSEADRLLLAETYLVLGDIQMENERFAEALSDFENCLCLQREYLEESSREIIQTVYKMSICNEFGGHIPEARLHAEQALQMLKQRMDALSLPENAEEYAELSDVCKDLQTKICDLEESRTNTTEDPEQQQKSLDKTVNVLQPRSLD